LLGEEYYTLTAKGSVQGSDKKCPIIA